MKISLSLDQELCTQCYSCISECPFDLLSEDKEGFPQLRKAAVKRCMRCGHCMAVCVADALDISISPLESSPPVDRSLLPSPESLKHFLEGRRSIRTYRKKSADRATLEKLLDVSRYAPSAHNKQPVHWIIVQDSEEVKQIAGLVVEYMKELKIFPGLLRAWDQGVDKVLRGAPHLVVTHCDPGYSEHPMEDCTLATAYFDLAANSYGMGSCWAGFLVQAAAKYQPLIDAFNLPEGHKVYTALMLGYPKYRYRHIPQRDEPKVTWK